MRQLYDSNNKEAFYKNLRHIHGPSAGGCSPLLNRDEIQLISDRPGILELMKEHVINLKKNAVIFR